MTVLSDRQVDPHTPASKATLDALDDWLDQLVPSAEPAVVFTSLAKVSLPAFSDGCTVEIVEDGGAAYLLDPAGPVEDGRGPVATPGSAAGRITTTFDGAAHGASCYRGVVRHTWDDREPTALDVVVARVLVGRAVALTAEQRLAEQARQAHDAVANLKIALASSRVIGNAVGILMVAYKITDAAAFDLLRDLSQRSNRRVADIASDVVMTGSLDRA